MSDWSAPRDTCLTEVDVVVLAGGLGTRLAPVVPETPKILAQVDGRPYLEFVFNWLSSFGARRIILALGHLADQVVAYIEARPPCEMIIEAVVEPSARGTGGAISYVRPRIKSEAALVINGDSFVDADLCAFVADFRDSHTDGAIICVEVEDAARYGTVELDEKNHIRRFLEKDSNNHGPGLINAGVYILGRSMLDTIVEMETGSLERDVFEKLKPGSLLATPGCHTFLDIGTPDDWCRAGAVLRPFMDR